MGSGNVLVLGSSTFHHLPTDAGCNDSNGSIWILCGPEHHRSGHDLPVSTRNQAKDIST